MGVGGQRQALVALPSGKTRYPFLGGWLGPKAGVYKCGKSLSMGFDLRAIQKVASRYTDCVSNQEYVYFLI